MRPQRAFTLLELLAVITVISILAIFLVTLIRTMHESSREATCATNMRQIVQAIRLYANDHNGMGPPGNNVEQHLAGGGVPGSTSLRSTYFYSVWPYIYGSWATHHNPNNTVTMNSLQKNIFHCPTRYALYPDAMVAPPEMFVGNKGASYAWWDSYAYPINGMAGSLPGANPASEIERSKSPVQVATMKYPSKTVAIVEGYCWYVTVSHHYYNRYGVLPHKGKANFAFYDGHIELRSQSEIPTKEEALQTVFWSGDNVE